MGIRICAKCVKEHIPEEDTFTAISTQACFLGECSICKVYSDGFNLFNMFPDDMKDKQEKISFVKEHCKNYYNIKKWKETNPDDYAKKKEKYFEHFHHILKE